MSAVNDFTVLLYFNKESVICATVSQGGEALEFDSVFGETNVDLGSGSNILWQYPNDH